MMIDAHVHFLHSTEGEYTFELLERIVAAALENKVDEIYLLEHTYQFIEFNRIYEPISGHNQYQHDWLSRKMVRTIDSYIDFIGKAKKNDYPISIKFGLEVCYIPETEDLLDNVLSQYVFDFLTGSVHYIDNWGFDHKAEFWDGVDVDIAYRRYYEIIADLIGTGLFNGLAHPDSIKCFHHYPSYDLINTYMKIAALLNEKRMYAEQNGGLSLNYGSREIGMNNAMLKVFRHNCVKILTASDAHKPEHTGANIGKLQELIDEA